MTTAKIASGPASSHFTDRSFKITERESSVGREIRGGVVTFLPIEASAPALVVVGALHR